MTMFSATTQRALLLLFIPRVTILRGCKAAVRLPDPRVVRSLRNFRSFRISVSLAATAAILLMGGCSRVGGAPAEPNATRAEPNAAPRFTGTVRDRTYLLSSTTCTIDLPKASGGNGSLVYDLTPAVPGWSFDSTERTLTLPTTTADPWEFTYRVEDTDDDTSGSDAHTLTFTITIMEPSDEAPRPAEGIALRYRGCGNQVFFLNPEGNALDDTMYTLELATTAGHVYVISTNTTAGVHLTPSVERLDASEVPAPDVRPLEAGVRASNRLLTAASIDHWQAWIAEFNNTPPSMLMDGVSPSLLAAQSPMSPPPVAEGDQFTFKSNNAIRFSSRFTDIPATARKVVSDGTVTWRCGLPIWTGAPARCASARKWLTRLRPGFFALETTTTSTIG